MPLLEPRREFCSLRRTSAACPSARALRRCPSDFRLLTSGFHIRQGYQGEVLPSEFTENRIPLYTTKAGTPVSVVIPDTLGSLLRAIQPRGGYFFVRGDSTSMH